MTSTSQLTDSERAQPEAPKTDTSSMPRPTLFDVLLILAPRWRLLVWLPLGVGVVVLGLTFLIPKTYTASVKLLPPQDRGSQAAALLGSLGGVAGALGGGLSGLKSPIDQWVAFLKSRTIAEAIVNRFKLKEIYKSKFQFQARDELGGNTRINAGRDGLISLEVDDHVPQRAADLANAYIEELQQLSTNLAVSEAAQRRLFFQRELDKTKTELIKAEVALRESGISPDVVKTSPTAAVSQLAQAQAAVAAQEVTLSVMRGTMTESNPDYQQAALQLASLREQLKRAAKDSPGQGSDEATKYVTRYRDFKYYETLFELYSRQLEAARADEAREGALVQVVDPPMVPEYKSGPKRAMLAVLATVFTGLLAVGYVLARNALTSMGRRPDGAVKLASLRRSLRSRERGNSGATV